MTTFQDLGLNPKIIDAIEALGYQNPTEIQQKAIPFFLQRQTDLIALAQTGTGKTAAFGLPILQHLSLDKNYTQALIIAPTRELCIQISNDLKNYSKFLQGVRIVSVYGGSSIMEQIRELKRGAHVIVATPGRLMDLMDRKAVKIEQIETVVLDEADEMLNMGFQEDIESILSKTPSEKMTGLFSATMPKEIRNIANKYLKDTEEVSVGKKNSTSSDITHQYAVVAAKEKFAALKRIIDFNENFFGIIFCTTRIETQDISDSLIKSGYNADCLHGDLSQQQRDKVMGKFRKRTVKILCATDVAARGIDVNDITHVIHYHLPDDIENYTHRSGRTARAGKKGISIALLHIKEAYKLHQIEKLANMKFEKFLIPKGDEIIAKRIQQYVSDFSSFDYQDASNIELKNEWVFPLMQMDKEELVQRLMARELVKFDTNLMEHADLNVDETQRSSRSSEKTFGRDRDGGRARRGERTSSEGEGEKLFINLGKKDGLRYDEMRELIFRNSKVSGHNIKDIEMQGVFSFFYTDAKSAERIISGFNQVEHKGREVRIERTAEQAGGGSGGGRTSGSPRKYGSSDRKPTFNKKSDTKPRSSSSSSSGASKPRYKAKDDQRW